MKAMIFAAGLGTRLRPLTDNMPKALVPVNGIPMLQRNIVKLRDSGFTDIIINVHHFGQQIIDFVNKNDNFGAGIHISDERDRLLDTGGGILAAKTWLNGDDPFLVHNADILSDIDLKELYWQHTSSGADVTLVVSDRKTSRKLLFDADLRLNGWINTDTSEVKPQGFVYDAHYRQLAFGGIHVISPHVFSHMGAGTPWTGKFSIIDFYLDYCRQAKILAYIPPSGTAWFDVGKHETLHQANEFYQDR